MRTRISDLGGPRGTGQRDLPLDADLAQSVTAAISEHRVRHPERPDEDADAIYEMPEESERASSLPGSLSQQDVVSENIKSRLEIHKFGKQTKIANSVFPDQVSDTVSKEAHKSVVQNNLPAIARVSKTVELVETSRSIQTFKMTYDRLFKKFQDRLI